MHTSNEGSDIFFNLDLVFGFGLVLHILSEDEALVTSSENYLLVAFKHFAAFLFDSSKDGFDFVSFETSSFLVHDSFDSNFSNLDFSDFTDSDSGDFCSDDDIFFSDSNFSDFIFLEFHFVFLSSDKFDFLAFSFNKGLVEDKEAFFDVSVNVLSSVQSGVEIYHYSAHFRYGGQARYFESLSLCLFLDCLESLFL